MDNDRLRRYRRSEAAENFNLQLSRLSLEYVTKGNLMLLALIAVVVGLILLIWSAEKFIDGAAATSRWLGLSPLLIGMLVIGFGTSAPEMMVSVLAAMQGNPGLAVGNAYGSNIVNIGLVLGFVALLAPWLFTQASSEKKCRCYWW